MLSDINYQQESKTALGVIVDCLSAKILEEPNESSAALRSITALTEVMVELDESTNNFYKVCTAAGIEGFCAKRFIALRK